MVPEFRLFRKIIQIANRLRCDKNFSISGSKSGVQFRSLGSSDFPQFLLRFINSYFTTLFQLHSINNMAGHENIIINHR